MPAQAPTWLHASGHRFLLRRIERALLGDDLRSVDAGPRTSATSLGCGAALALVAVLACACFALLRPQPQLGETRLVMGKASGALYVRVGDTWHPVLNLASARLIITNAVNPVPVPESELIHMKRGVLLGIPGAPPYLAPPLPTGESVWTVCDDDGGTGTTVLVGSMAESAARLLERDQAVLATTAAGSPSYLLYRGRRAVVDLRDPAVLHALGLVGQAPRIVSQSLLNAVPEAPPIAVPHLRGSGEPAGAWLPGFAVGSVLRITRAAGEEFYVVLGSGVQRIGRLTADLLRFADSQGAATAPAVAPDVIRAAPVLNAPAVAGLPDEAPARISAATTVCAAWTGDRSGTSGVGLLTRTPSGRPVILAQADGRGPALDAVYLPPGHSAFVVAQGFGGTAAAIGTRYLVTDTGVRFPIHDDAAARALGLPATAVAAPWPMLAILPCGPELSSDKALLARDTVGAGSP